MDPMYQKRIEETSNIAWHRPQSATARVEDELMDKSSRALCGTTDPLERMRLLCLSQGASGIMGLSRVFRLMDVDGSKQLSKEEFFTGIRDAGLDLAGIDTEALFERFDVNRDGSINIEEFVRQLRPPMNDGRKAIVEQAFRKLDKHKKSVIDLEDLRRAYQVESHPLFMSGEETAEKILDRFIAVFEKEGPPDGKVTLEEFMNYYSGISVSIDNDCYFNLMMRQAYKL